MCGLIIDLKGVYKGSVALPLFRIRYGIKNDQKAVKKYFFIKFKFFEKKIQITDLKIKLEIFKFE